MWLAAPDEALCPMEQMKVWALREAWYTQNKSVYGMHTFIASKVRKNWHGKNNGDNPTNVAVKQLLDKNRRGASEGLPGGEFVENQI